jgi:hypothetical protein
VVSGRPESSGHLAAWNDARLEAAFSDRAAATPPTPSGLEEEVAERIKAHARSTPWPLLAAAAAVMAGALVVVGADLFQGPQPSQTPPIAAASSEPPATVAPAPTPDTRVRDALGDPISVREALGIERAPADRDREMLVSGFLSQLPTIYCALQLGPRNPTRPRCPDDLRWFMDDPQPFGSEPPSGPTIHPSFALVTAPEVPWPDEGPAMPKPVVLAGHFQDRRAALCTEQQRADCEAVFVVDRVVSVDGVEQPIVTRVRTEGLPIEQSADVDALVGGAAPGSILASRQLLPLSTAFDAEPGLRTDDTLENWSPASQATWIETVIDLRAGMPVARTFILLDGTSWFAEVTSAGAELIERTVAPASPKPWPAMPTADPSAFAAAPTNVFGIPVRSLGAIQADRQATMDSLGRDELAVRAWVLGPAPGASCDESLVRVPPPAPPCDAKRTWLLDDPQQFGLYTGQLRVDPRIDRWAPILNPIIPVDVPFDAGATWRDDRPVPVPVVVLGHFSDNRVGTYAGNLYFVIDALAWTPDGPATTVDSVVRLTSSATEDLASVLERIGQVSPNVAVASWVTVMDAADFAGFDRNFAQSREFGTGTPVWIVRRLVRSETDGRERLAIEWAWTHDGGARVWLTETPDSPPDLATTLEIHDLDAHTASVRVVDYDEAITSVSPAPGLAGLRWKQPLGNATDAMQVAQGRSSRELVLRWSGSACATAWRVNVSIAADGHVYVSPTTMMGCEGGIVVRTIAITFDRPIDIDKVEGPSCCG